jgi:hypothetical protein
MADNIIGTGVSDPDFYSHQASRLGGAISSIVGGWRQRQEQKAAEDQAEIDRAFKMMQQAPELADTWGAALVKKYGSQYPEVPAMVSVIQNRKALAKEIPEAGTAWETAVQKRKDEHVAAQARAAAMPDYIDHPIGPNSLIPGPAGLALSLAGAIGPNAEKQKEIARLQQVDPNYFSGEALNDLPVHQANAARLYAKEKGIPIVQATPFDRFKQLSPRNTGLEAVRAGLIPADSETAQSLQNEAKLEASAADLQKQQFQQGERLGRQGHQEQMMDSREGNIRERMALSDRIALAREMRHLSDQVSLIDYRASKKGGSNNDDGAKIKYTDIVSASRDAASEYDRKKSEALLGVSKDELPEVLAEFKKNNGERPHVLTRYVAKKIVDMSEDSDDAALMAEQLSDAVTRGHQTEEGALKVLRQFSKEGVEPGTPDEWETRGIIQVNRRTGKRRPVPSFAGGAKTKGVAEVSQKDVKRASKPAAAPTVVQAGKPVAKPKAPPGAADTARQRARMKFPGLNQQQIEEKVKQFMAETYG